MFGNELINQHSYLIRLQFAAYLDEENASNVFNIALKSLYLLFHISFQCCTTVSASNILI